MCIKSNSESSLKNGLSDGRDKAFILSTSVVDLFRLAPGGELPIFAPVWIDVSAGRRFFDAALRLDFMLVGFRFAG